MSGSSLKKKTPANPQFGLLWKSKEIIVLDLKLTVMIYQLQSRNLLHSALTRPSSANARRLKSRHPFVLYLPCNISSVYLTTATCVRRSGRITSGVRSGRTAPQDSAFSSLTPAPTPPEWPSQEEPGYGLTASAPVPDRSCLYKWDMTSSAACECGAEEQTVDHVVLHCPIHRPPHGLHGLTVPDDETIEWLLNTCPEI